MYGDLRNTWEAIMNNHVTKMVTRTVRKSDGSEEKKDMARGYTDTGLRARL